MLGTVTRRQKLIGGVTGGVVTIAMVLALVLGGRSSVVPHQGGSSGARILLWLLAPRDMGRLPARADWCTGADHCWLAQETAGATQLADETGGWTLDASGTPRAGVATSLPVEDATGWVDFTSELSTHTDGQSASGTGSWWRAAQTQSATNLVSVSAIILPVYRQATARVLYSHRATASTAGIEVGVATTGRLYATVESTAATTLTITTADPVDDGAWHAVTWHLDGRTTGAARIYVDGEDVTAPAAADLNTGGTWATTGPVTVGADAAWANVWPGGIARLRVTVGVLDDPAEVTGTLWQPIKVSDTTKVNAAADVAWAQTGQTRWVSASAATALAIPGGKAGPTWSPSVTTGYGRGWGMEASRVNRMLINAGPLTQWWASTNHGTMTMTSNAAVAPDGTKTATTITGIGGMWVNYLYHSGWSGFSANATLYPVFWVRCSSGQFRIMGSTDGSLGNWRVNCPTVAGVWRRITTGDAAILQTTAWKATASGAIAFAIYADAGSVDADIWIPTLVEAPGDSAIRSPGTDPATTGPIAWAADNDPYRYYCGTRGKVSITGDWTTGQCLDIASTGTNAGRVYGDGTHWYTFDASGTADATGHLALSGLDAIVWRWDSVTALTPGVLAELLLNGAAQTWDATPDAAWTAGTPAAVRLSGYGSSSCRGVISEIKIENRP